MTLVPVASAARTAGQQTAASRQARQAAATRWEGAIVCFDCCGGGAGLQLRQLKESTEVSSRQGGIICWRVRGVCARRARAQLSSNGLRAKQYTYAINCP